MRIDIQKEKLGMIFSGGAAKGLCGLGVIRYFQERKIVPYISAGASAGSILASFSAFEVPWEQCVDVFKRYRPWNVMSISNLLFNRSAISDKKFRKFILKNFPQINENTRIEDAPNKLVIYTSDPTTRERVYLDSGNLIDSILASSAVVGILNPQKVGKNYLVDGDISGAYAASEIRKRGAEKIIGVTHTTHPHSVKDMNKHFHVRVEEAVESAIELERKMSRELDPLDALVNFDTTNVKYLDVKKIPRYYLEAYKSAKKIFGE